MRRLKKEYRMAPLPKWVGVLMWLISNAGTIYAGYQQGGAHGALTALIGLLTSTGILTAHSLTGNGTYVPPGGK
jgi:hypothetical protein